MTNKEAVNWLINVTADIGKAEHRDLWHYEQALTEIREMLEADVRENRRGHWVKSEYFGGRGRLYRCDHCGNYLDFRGVNAGRGDANFCPNCGADMRPKTEENDATD